MYSQPPVDSCGCSGIHYTDDQDVKCLECLINRSKHLDKIEKLQIQKIEFAEYVQDQKIEIEILRDEKALLMDENAKLERSKQFWRSATFAAVGLIVVETVIILIK